jgi:hypothetical protein
MMYSEYSTQSSGSWGLGTGWNDERSHAISSSVGGIAVYGGGRMLESERPRGNDLIHIFVKPQGKTYAKEKQR